MINPEGRRLTGDEREDEEEGRERRQIWGEKKKTEKNWLVF